MLKSNHLMKHIYCYYQLIKDNTCRILFPYSKILQSEFPSKLLHMKLGTWNRTGYYTYLLPFRNHGNTKYFNTFPSTIHRLDRPHQLFLAQKDRGPSNCTQLLGYLFLEGHEINHSVRSFVIVNGIYNYFILSFAISQNSKVYKCNTLKELMLLVSIARIHKYK